MKLIIKLTIYCIINIIVWTNYAYSYDWPLVNGQVQHQINATFAECRGARDHFHNGIDIQATEGTVVIAIEGGTVYRTETGAGLNIGHYRYYHLTDMVEDEEVVSAGDTIGYTDSGNHIHLIESSQIIDFDGDIPNDQCVNPLRDEGLSPFDDHGDPIIDNVTIYRQGTNDVVTNNTLFGQLDFAVEAHDPGVLSTGNANNASSCGVYKIEIEFINSNDEIIGDNINYLTFNEIPSNANINWAFASGSNSSNFIYWATNDPFHEPHNKYWNTRQRVDSNYDVDARFAGEALYNEGGIRIRIIVEDIDGNQDTHEIEL